jgi:hypothetical protein
MFYRLYQLKVSLFSQQKHTTQRFDNYLFPSSSELNLTSNQVNHHGKSGEAHVQPFTKIYVI